MNKTTRTTLLQAANRVVLQHGAAALTLEVVAREAGVSKGGLLYHFPNKDALVDGMIDHLFDMFDVAMERELARDTSSSAGRWLRAYVRANAASDEITQVSTALLAAVGTNSELLAAKKARFAQWHQRALDDGLDPATANIVRLAVDGLWMNDLFGFTTLDAQERAAFTDALLAMTHGEHL